MRASTVAVLHARRRRAQSAVQFGVSALRTCSWLACESEGRECGSVQKFKAVSAELLRKKQSAPQKKQQSYGKVASAVRLKSPSY